MRFEETCFADRSHFIMADPLIVAQTEGVEFKLNQLEKREEPVLRPTARWEGGDGKQQRPVQNDPLDGTVLYDLDNRQFTLWYRTHNGLIDPAKSTSTVQPPSRGSWVCLARSSDGIDWEKPELGKVPFNQCTANNMLVFGEPVFNGQHLSGVTLNRVPGIEGSLIATAYGRFNDSVYPHGITFLSSPDGIDWNPHFPPSLPLDGDAHCLMWDWHRGCYICTTRSYAYDRIVNRLQTRGCDLRVKRHVAIASSRDLVHWTPMVPVMEADADDPPNAQLYTMYVLPYGHGYLGFVQLFYMQEPEMTGGPLEMQLAFSRNLKDWVRVGKRTPILPRGAEGAWDCSHVVLTTNPPHPEGDRLRFWYGGKDAEHWQYGNASLGTATLRRDGFASYEAGPEGGTVTTAPFNLEWATRVQVNADASQGELRVEILDADTFQPLEGTAADDCQPVCTDSVQHQVAFGPRRGTFVRHTGRIRFRFHLKSAGIYSFYASRCNPE